MFQYYTLYATLYDVYRDGEFLQMRMRHSQRSGGDSNQESGGGAGLATKRVGARAAS